MASPTAKISPPRFRPIDLPARLSVPCAGEPTVEVGATVRRGQSLDGSSGSEHRALAPADGRIASIGRATLLNMHDSTVVEVEVDSTNAAEAQEHPPATGADVREFLNRTREDTAQQWIDRLGDLGVCANRWTSPDLIGQLRQCSGRSINTVVCNLLDPGPSLLVNRAAAQANGAELVAAVAKLGQLVGASRQWVVVDESLPVTTWTAVRESAAAAARDLRIVPLENDYPQPDPTLLLYTLTRRKLRPGRLPVEQGVLLLDAPAAVAVGRAMLFDEPMLRVPLAIHDQPRDRSHLLRVPVGMKLGDVLATLDMPRHGLDLRAGGPLREMRVNGDCVVAGGELAVFAVAREPDVNPNPCIRCGWCLEGCPVRIHPAGLLEAAQQEDHGLAERYGLHACIECGICSYVCPSHLPLLGGIRLLRGERAALADDDDET
jgi:electron transport complex protein RnfC